MNQVLVEENDVQKLLVSASGEGASNYSTTSSVKQMKKSNATDDEEEKETLVQQVADGNYGLIQTELCDKPSKRPDIISYDVNPEVPKDNVNNLGGLKADEILLAEKHLLVLKGGGFSKKDVENITWKPIDNYVAPKRKVKIIPKPKVAPPFPVQLKNGGPIAFIKGVRNSLRCLGPPLFSSNIKNNLSVLPPACSYPFPPFGFSPPPPYPFSGNFTDLDEVHPRFYYPPSYDFGYKQNSSHEAHGPLVPGIVLPPTNFLAPLVNTNKRPIKKPKRSTGTYKNKPNLFNTFLPKTTYAYKAKPITIEPPTVTIKPRERDEFISIQDKKEGRKLEGMKRPSNLLAMPVTRAPETTTKYSRVMNRPPETTTVYVRVASHPPLTTSTIVPKNMIPKNNGECVPIAGPSICPPTDLKCFDLPIRHDNRYNHLQPSFNNSTVRPFNFVTEIPAAITGTSNNHFYPMNAPRLNYYTTTASPYYDLKPIIVPTVTTESYKSLEPNNYNPRETYYIHEQLEELGDKVILKDYNTPEIGNGPAIVNDVTPKYEENTVSPLQVIRHQTVKKPKVKVKNKPCPLELFENELSSITNSNKFSITYTVGGRRPDVNQIAGYSYNVPLDGPFDNTIKNSQRNIYRKKKSWSKTPVFKYNFSVPGYGQDYSPKISSVIPSTEKPVNALRHPQCSFFGFDSRPLIPFDQYEINTQCPLACTSQRAKYRRVILNQFNEFLATEAPYTERYTQQEPKFIDDITKNCFTLFGKKIKSEVYSKYETTPLPPPAEEVKVKVYNGVKQRQRATKGPKRQNISFPKEAVANMEPVKGQKEKNYGIQNGGGNANSGARPAISKPEDYDNRYYNNYKPNYYPPDYSLASDINVNYRKPYPLINPEAEYIDPSYVQGENPLSNSYISYQLPGNGDHFYFLRS